LRAWKDVQGDSVLEKGMENGSLTNLGNIKPHEVSLGETQTIR